MTVMKINLVTTRQTGADQVLVLPVFEDEKPQVQDSPISQFLKDSPKFGKSYDSQLLYTEKGRVLLLGAGKKEKLNFELCQNWAGAAAKFLLGKCREAILTLPQTENLSPQYQIRAVTLGVNLAAHDPSQSYKSEKNPKKLDTVQLLLDKATPEHKEGFNKGQVLSEVINKVRILGDMPANEMTPAYFLSEARKIARQNGLKMTVVDEKKAQKLGMGAFVGVAKGSDEPSYIIALEYQGHLRSKEKWGLVGKGITFDSGGISIKPSAGMHEMKYDMCGAAAVLGIMQAVAKLKLKANVVGVMAVTENLPSGKALKPGDIVKSYSGKTVEVLNTDAEGRMVLADALTLAQKDFKANKLVDLATLTGAMIVTLGDFMTGIFSNDSELSQKIIQAGRRVGEKMWELPMEEEYDEMIKSEIADITNIGHGGSMPGAAGSITGAKFIEAVVKKGLPWAHLDIAGTAWDMKPKPYRGVGATGVGVKTLVELISQGQ